MGADLITSTVGPWGTWSSKKYCPTKTDGSHDNYYAFGFKIFVDRYYGGWWNDDKGAITVQLICERDTRSFPDFIYSGSEKGPATSIAPLDCTDAAVDWSEVDKEFTYKCPMGSAVVGLRTRVKPATFDQRAMVDMQFKCWHFDDISKDGGKGYVEGRTIGGYSNTKIQEAGPCTSCTVSGCGVVPCKYIDYQGYNYDSTTDWGEWEYCSHTNPYDYDSKLNLFVRAFKIKYESPQGSGDDTALNAVELTCDGPSYILNKNANTWYFNAELAVIAVSLCMISIIIIFCWNVCRKKCNRYKLYEKTLQDEDKLDEDKSDDSDEDELL
eukprot:88582_1